MDAVCIVGIWVLCGIIAASIYKNKGRRESWGFLVGLLLGPLGILYAAVRSPDTGRLEREQLRTGQAKRCPHCGELIRPEATICKHCHQAVTSTK